MANFLVTQLFCFLTVVSAHKILIFQPTPSISHQQPAMGLTEALVTKGHDVYVLSPNVVPGLEKNYTHFDFSWLLEGAQENATNQGVNLQQEFTSVFKWIPFWEVYAGMVRHMFGSDTFKHFFKRVQDDKLSFDVVIVESFLIPYGVALARLVAGNKPVISLASMTGGDFYDEDAIGNIKHLSFSPSMLSPYSDRMSLWQRLENWVVHHYISRRLRDIVESSARAYFRETRGPDGETLVGGCWRNISLALISSNALYYYPRPVSPNVVEVGPLHIKAPSKLPKRKLVAGPYEPRPVETVTGKNPRSLTPAIRTWDKSHENVPWRQGPTRKKECQELSPEIILMPKFVG